MEGRDRTQLGTTAHSGRNVYSPLFPCQYRGMQAFIGSSHGRRGMAALLGGSMALTVALFADGFAFFVLDRAGVLWLAVVAIASAFAGHWLLRSTPTSVLSVLAGAVGVLHLVRALW